MQVNPCGCKASYIQLGLRGYAMKPTKTWILLRMVAASILEVAGKGKVSRMISGSDAKLDNRPSHKQGRDRPGHVHESSVTYGTLWSRDTIRIVPAKRSLPGSSEPCLAATQPGMTSIGLCSWLPPSCSATYGTPCNRKCLRKSSLRSTRT